MASAAHTTTRLVSIERDPTRADATQELFAAYERVRVLTGDWPALLEHGPLDRRSQAVAALADWCAALRTNPVPLAGRWAG